MAGRGRGSRRAAVLVAAGLALVLGGCEALLGPGFGGDFPSSSPIAAYTTGTATIAITGGETIKLERVAQGSGVDSLFGSDVRWTGPSGYITLDRIVDGQHWTTMFDGSRCITDVDLVDATGIRGSPTCKGVAWYDALDMEFTQGPPKPLDEPKFDAEITFEAVP